MENNQVKQYLNKCFNKKTLITKGIIYGIATILLLAIAIPFFFWLIDKNVGDVIGKNPFWYIEISHNTGSGFSMFDGKTALIYTIQTLLSIILIAIFLFVTNDRISSSFVALAIVGGLFNLFQRIYSGGFVLDYFRFGFWENFAIFNWPDMFIVIGTFGFVITIIVKSIISAIKDSNDEKEHESNKYVKIPKDENEAVNNSSNIKLDSVPTGEPNETR